MCTAISYKNNKHYFGRNLDLEYSYEESVTITPRNFPIRFRKEREFGKHYAMIGMAYVKDEYPLYYDAVNERGLAMAGLSFPGNAVYRNEDSHMYNVAPFELIPWVLGQCESVKNARNLLEKTNLINMSYDRELQVTPLHFMLSDQNESIVIEPCEDGIVIRNNPVNVLTNNPPFLYQLHNLNNYISLSKKEPVNLFARELPLEIYSRGMGALGLPGDMSSMSRFVRAAYVRWNLVDGRTEEENISQFFHILSSVEQYKGCVLLENGKYEYTIYSSCCNTELGIYYYKTYNNSRITAVDLRREDLESKKLISYAVKRECRIDWDN